MSPQSGFGSQLGRLEADYRQLYFDDIETLSPTVGPGFVLDVAGSLASNPAEVIAGTRSIKGVYSGTGSYTPYLRTLLTALPFTPGHEYRVTFRYRILTAPSNGFETLFYSPTGGAAGQWLPSLRLDGPAGTAGTATLTNTLGQHSDYEVRWNIVGTGAISIDEIQIVDMTTGKKLAAEDGERKAPGVGTGLRLINEANVVTDLTLVISGQASVRLHNWGAVATNPAVVPLSGNTTYIVEVRYHILDPGPGENMLAVWFQPEGSVDCSICVFGSTLFRNAAPTGVFSSGALTGSERSYTLRVSSLAQTDVVIDDITVFQQVRSVAATQPSAWSRLEAAPYPRLGKYELATTHQMAEAGGMAEGPRLRISLEEVESRLAFADVIIGLETTTQTQEPDSARRISQLNPSAVMLPYRISWEQQQSVLAPFNGEVYPTWLFLQGLADSWYLRDSQGDYSANDYPYIRHMNISPSCPVVNGDTYVTHLVHWLDSDIFPSGLWDGVFLDNLFGRINPHIINRWDPALVDVDYNRNGIRDETPGWVSDLTRRTAIETLKRLGSITGDQQLIIGNAGHLPELSLAPYVNGYVFECANLGWNVSWLTGPSAMGWRMSFDAYREMHETSRLPRTTLIEGCGPGLLAPGESYSTPTATDILKHRFTLGTALLGDGFYWYDLHGNLSAPLWFDEYSVDATGTAVEDRTKKGYLGQPLGDAAELTDSGVLLFEEDFEAGTLPASFLSSPLGVASVTHAAGEVITGDGSLVISNPDHTKQAYVGATTNPHAVPLAAPNLYLLTFDWRILETLDGALSIDVFGNGPNKLDAYDAPGIVAGDSGTAHVPFLISTSEPWTIRFAIVSGGGKVAIDNVRVFRGGVEPWRRDFENGFVLVNPLPQQHTFSGADLAGSSRRTGIRRIKGTQAPDVNNGQAATGSLTLDAFDAIILLADRIASQNARLDPRFATVGAAGGGGTVAVVGLASGASWTASTNAVWLTVVSGASGTGNGSVAYTVNANAECSSRTGTLVIAGQPFTVSQTAGVYSIDPTSISFGAFGGTGGLSITAATGCSWSAISDSPWLTLSATTGTGTTSVGFAVTPNGFPSSRTATVNTGGHILVVTQAAVEPPGPPRRHLRGRS